VSQPVSPARPPRRRSLSDTVAQAGSTLDHAGRAIEVLSVVPVVGEAPEELARRVRTAAAEVQAAGRSSRQSIRNLSLLLGFAIALVPATPVLGFYLPLRVRRTREVRAVARRLAAGGDPALEALLARRAVQYLPYHRLQQVSADPVADLRAGRFRRLAEAKLDRLGVPPAALTRRVYA
jgi:hypothetical protein